MEITNIFVFLLFDMLAGIYIGGVLGYLLSVISCNTQGRYGQLTMELNVIFCAMLGVTVGFFYWLFLEN